MNKIFKAYPVHLTSSLICLIISAIGLAAFVTTSSPVTGALNLFTILTPLIFIILSFSMTVPIAFNVSMALNLPAMLMRTFLFGNSNGDFVYFYVLLIGAVMLLSLRRSLLWLAIYCGSMLGLYFLHPHLPVVQETDLATFLDPIVSIFNFRALDENLSIFHYEHKEWPSNWQFVNQAVVGLAMYCALFAYKFQINRANAQIVRLLENIIPPVMLSRLNAYDPTSQLIADEHREVSVLMADLVGFTALSAKTPPEDLVKILNSIFYRFDDLVDKWGIEKIKTMGDGYFVVGGAPVYKEDHLENIVRLAIDMQDALRDAITKGECPEIGIRIGIHVGKVVAGVIGKRKFAYDLWGDTVNIASRLESSGVPGKIHISDVVAEKLSSSFTLESRGLIELKGKGEMQTYFVQQHLD